MRLVSGLPVRCGAGKGIGAFHAAGGNPAGDGQDWKGVHLTLASADPGSGLQPGSLPNWTLRKVEHMPRALAASPVMEQAAMDAAPNMMMKAAPPLDVREMATFAAWDLGDAHGSRRSAHAVRVGAG